MYCGFKMANPALASHFDSVDNCYISQNWECERTSCELWNEHFGRCSFAVGALLKGNEDYLKEKADERKDRQ